MRFDPWTVERKRGVLDDANKYAGETDADFVAAEDYAKLLALYQIAQEDIEGRKRAYAYGKDCDEQLWSELGVPKCELHGDWCWPHVAHWLVKEMKRLREGNNVSDEEPTT